jgi:lyso-ornithine lipid O-acyltransferase
MGMTNTRRLPPIGRPGADPTPGPPQRFRLGAQRLRLIWRVLAFVFCTAPAGVIQAALIALPGDAKRRFARLYWATVCRILGLERHVIGRPARREHGRAVLFASNHTSWLDIPALGGTLQACFVAKAEVGQWPVIRIIAWLGRTVFVSRRASETGRERDGMRARLEEGDDLILFPEGTSSDGARVLPFRSSFFSVAETRDGMRGPLIQPVSIVYDRLDGLPMGKATRPVSSWYGDMDLGSHFWQLAGHRHLRATILLHEPVDPTDYTSRKTLSHTVWQIVAEGAARLRQNRPAVPLAPQAGPVDARLSLDSAASPIATVAAG